MKNIQRTKNSFWHLALIWVTLTSTFPFIFYTWPFHPYKLLTSACLILMILLLLVCKSKVSISKNIVYVFILQIIYYLIISLAYFTFDIYNLVIQIISCLVICIYIKQYISFPLFAKSYILFIIYMGIGGVITFFIHVFIGLNPLFEIQYSASGISYFLGLTTTNVYYNLDSLRIIRFSGFFDEPGAFALYSIFALILNKIYYKNRSYEILLIFTTVFTFSMAYYVIIFMYFVLFYAKMKYIKYYMMVVFAIAVFGFYLNNYSGDNRTIEYLERFTFERFETSDDGLLKGDNRVDAQRIDKDIFVNNILCGVVDSTNLGGNNIYTVLARFGIVGSIFYYLLIFYFLRLILKLPHKQRVIYLKLLFILLLNLFHRPEFSSAFIIISIYTMIYKIENKYGIDNYTFF